MKTPDDTFPLNMDFVLQLKNQDVHHLSFDFWNTLAAANSNFATARTMWIADTYNLEVDFVKSTYTKLKHELDDYIQLSSDKDLYTVTNVPTAHIKLAQRLGIQHNFNLYESIRMFRVLFAKHPPFILPDTIRMLQALSKHFTISIGSNTNFVSGSTIEHVVIDNWNVPFLFTLFSDLERVAKPCVSFFYKMHDRRLSLLPNKEFTFNSIMHFGDNVICDGQGPVQAGMQSHIVKNPQALVNLFETQE